MTPRDFRHAPKRPDCRDLVSGFVSLGINCEFGLIQRHCEAEPLGLLRFTFTPLHGLLRALACRFDGVGDRDKLTISVLPNGEFMATHEIFSLDFHTQMKTGKFTEAEVLDKVSRHVGYLAGMLMDDLAVAEKIFVYRPLQPDAPLARADTLYAAMRRFGPATLLWAAYSADPARIGTVRWRRPGEIMIAYLDHYSPARYAANASFDLWLRICEQAASLRRAGAAGPRDQPGGVTA
jgi:hypothetical protein